MSTNGLMDSKGQNYNKEEDDNIEILMRHLIDSNLIEIPLEEIFDNIQPDEISKMIAKRVELNILSRLGIATLGSYLVQQREKIGLERATLARQAKIAHETLTELETDQIKFSDLSPKRAADIFDLLKLDIRLIIDFLESSFSLSTKTQKSYGSLFRSKQNLTDEQRNLLQEQLNKSDTDPKDKLNQFTKDFLVELNNRKLI